MFTELPVPLYTTKSPEMTWSPWPNTVFALYSVPSDGADLILPFALATTIRLLPSALFQVRLMLMLDPVIVGVWVIF
jgi:hypothetical protein